MLVLKFKVTWSVSLINWSVVLWWAPELSSSQVFAELSSQSQSHVTTDGQSVGLSWCRAPSELSSKLRPAYNASARTDRKHSSSIVACVAVGVPTWLLPSQSIGALAAAQQRLLSRCLFRCLCLATGPYATLSSPWFSNWLFSKRFLRNFIFIARSCWRIDSDFAYTSKIPNLFPHYSSEYSWYSEKTTDLKIEIYFANSVIQTTECYFAFSHNVNVLYSQWAPLIRRLDLCVASDRLLAIATKHSNKRKIVLFY
jgi:hypothetical protein